MRHTILGSLKRRGLSVGLVLVLGVLAFSAVAAADTVGSINFDSSQGYDPGNINRQNGWSKTGPYDANVASTTRFAFGQALRISNAVTSGSFSDQTFSPGLTNPASESSAMKHFEASFDIGTTSNDEQPGLAMSVSPDNGQGSRMSYLRFVDQPNGVHVNFMDDATFARDRHRHAKPHECPHDQVLDHLQERAPTTSRSSSTARRRSAARPGRTTTATTRSRHRQAT